LILYETREREREGEKLRERDKDKFRDSRDSYVIGIRMIHQHRKSTRQDESPPLRYIRGIIVTHMVEFPFNLIILFSCDFLSSQSQYYKNSNIPSRSYTIQICDFIAAYVTFKRPSVATYRGSLPSYF